MTVNKILYRLSKSYREIYYSIFPDTEYLSIFANKLIWGLAIETCNICNANCIFCGYQYQKRKKNIMPEEMFKKVIHDYNSIGGGGLGLCSTVGDPLLDPYILNRIHYARQLSNIKDIMIITNCINLHNVGVNKLLTSGLTGISVSTSGFDLKVYDQIYRSNKADLMKTNLIELLKMNKELGKPCKISINLRTYQRLNEVLNNPDFKQVEKMSDAISINYFFDDWGGRIKPADLPKGMRIRPLQPLILRKRNPCAMLYGGIAVLSNGTVTVCSCRDLNGDSDLVLGNIMDNSLIEMYKSDYLRLIRENWLNGSKIPDICHNCRHYNSYSYMMLKEVRIRANV